MSLGQNKFNGLSAKFMLKISNNSNTRIQNRLSYRVSGLGKTRLVQKYGNNINHNKNTKYIRSSFSGKADCNQDHQQPFFFNRSSALRFRTRQKRTCSPLVTLKVKETFWTPEAILGKEAEKKMQTIALKPQRQ